jgi:hypothetical protein
MARRLLTDMTWASSSAYGNALVGSPTGNQITQDAATLTCSGGVLGDVLGDAQFRVICDLSAFDEVVRLDNFEITQTVTHEADPDDGKGGQYDVQYTAGIRVLGPVGEDQLKAVMQQMDEEEDDLFA